jgi:hypothetical protein
MLEFIDLTKKYDPHGKFRSEFLNKNIFASSHRAVRLALWGTKTRHPTPTVPAATLLHHLASSFLDNFPLRSLSAKSGVLLSKSRHVAHISPSKLLNRPGRRCLPRGKTFTFSGISVNYGKECLCV